MKKITIDNFQTTGIKVLKENETLQVTGGIISESMDALSGSPMVEVNSVDTTTTNTISLDLGTLDLL